MKVWVSAVKGSILSKSPDKLLEAMKTRMAQKEPKGKIKTWACDSDGDFRYLVEQYDGVAWVRPVVTPTAIDLKLVWPENSEPPQEIKGIFLGRFVEMLLGHFATTDFSETKVSPLI